MSGIAITFILIAFLPSPCCQRLFSHPTTQLVVILSVCWCTWFPWAFKRSSSHSQLVSACFPRLCPCTPTYAEESGCFKVNNCKCIMKDGSAVTNLKAMGDADGFLERLKPVSAEDMPGGAETLLSSSPCQAFSQPEDLTGAGCTNVVVRWMSQCDLCVRYHGLNSHFISYGRHEGNEFHYNDTLKMLSVSYFSHDGQPLTVVHYHCDPHQPTSLIRDQRLSTEVSLQIWVESLCACPNACAVDNLGLGTIFLIMLPLGAAAYFIHGSCALRPYRSISGAQISPEQRVVHDLLPLY